MQSHILARIQLCTRALLMASLVHYIATTLVRGRLARPVIIVLLCVWAVSSTADAAQVPLNDTYSHYGAI